MKAWITKYALTKGILEVEGVVWDSAIGRCLETKGANGPLSEYYFRDKWHETKEAAIEKAESMRKKKIESLKRQIDKLEQMKFE